MDKPAETAGQRPTSSPANSGSPVYSRYATKLSAVAIIVAICLPLLQYTPWSGQSPAVLANARAVPHERTMVLDTETAPLLRRADSPTDVCTRFSHQSAIINGTLYIYGGQATESPGQKENKWNNNFLSLDLTNSWQISTPSLKGLSQPSGPPNVSNGFLWNSHESLFLYGGEFSDSPPEAPSAFSLFEYNAVTSQWYEHDNPQTESGIPVQRSAEGAGASVAGLGRGWYFGGHLDGYTTEGWSQSVARVYIKSLIEFTFPGYANKQVDTLSDGQSAGTDGAWRNVTEGGSQDSAGFPERADGLLLYIPGFGDEGLLVGLAGGTNDTFTQMNVIDVYDVATSQWTKQTTSGPTPEFRVNPCAVVAAAADGSSYQVYMFGGQNLQPAKQQIQYNDMWILTIPSFTWIEVDQSKQSVPYGRAGHSCQLWDSQMVVVGGYVGDQLSCDSPGIYVFNTSSLNWETQFTSLSAGSGSGSPDPAQPGNGTSPEFVSRANPFNQQPGQITNGTSVGGLEGSYGYSVPDTVVSVIGGNGLGGATVTAPVQTPTDGPLKTGTPIIYATPTSGSNSTTNAGSGSGSNKGSSGPNIAAIVVGTIAGILFIIVCYFAFCAWLYRKRLGLYKRHVEMTQQAALAEKPNAPGLLSGGRQSTSQASDEHRRMMMTSEENSGKGSSRRNDWGWVDANGVAQGSLLRRSSDDSGAPEDLLAGNEPSFWGTVLAPRRSLRVVNRD